MIPKIRGLCEDFVIQSRRTWNTIKKSESIHLNFSEESITDLNLLELQHKHPLDIITVKFDKPQESIEGADWEWGLISSSRYMGLRIQAKKIRSRTLCYPKLDYVTPGGSRQIDELINRAKKDSPPKVPFYVLYNYWDRNNYRARWLCPLRRRDIRMLGCGIVEARALRTVVNQGKKRLFDIDGMMYPWSCLMCCRVYSSGYKALPDRAFDFLSNVFGNQADFAYERDEYVVEKAPWYIHEILEGRELSEEAGEKIGVNMITIIKEQFRT